MRPAERQTHRGVSAIPGQPLEAIIAINLQHALESRQVPCRANDPVILGIDICCRGMAFASPWPIIDRIAPVSSDASGGFARATLARRADPSGATCIALVPRAPAVDMCPVGRPRRMPNRKFAPSSASTGVGRRRGGSCPIRREVMTSHVIDWFAVIDWGSERHQVCVLNCNGEIIAERAFLHTGSGLAELGTWLASFTVEGRNMAIAIEVPHGPIVDLLLDRGFVVYAINPKQLDRLRDRFSIAGSKD